jgi:hypothetical protein
MKTIAVITGVILSYGVFSQDMINTNDGKSISAKVLEIGTTEVKYKNSNNQDGPVYVMNKSDVSSIKYENGTEDVFSQTVDNGNKVNGYNTDPNGATNTSSSSNGGYASSGTYNNGSYGNRNYNLGRALAVVAVGAAIYCNQHPRYYAPHPQYYSHSCGNHYYGGRHR